jgi:hypothetical protein
VWVYGDFSPILYTATFLTWNIEKYWVAIKLNGAVSWKYQDSLRMSCDAGSLHAVRCATSAPQLNTRRFHYVTGHVAACFLISCLFGYPPFACGLFYALISYFSLHIKPLFLSRLLVYVFSFFLYLFLASFFFFTANCRFISFCFPLLCIFCILWFFFFLFLLLGLGS